VGRLAFLHSAPAFDTYEDHRMAMAFAPLAMKGAIEINDPMVVVKSYPQFWEDLEVLGFEVVD
jgi:3-phosphoshikimate 1-carboxyvinyltransferase